MYDESAHSALQQSARDHLWMHFTRMSSYDTADVPVIVRGEGAYVWDAQGRKYLDALGATPRTTEPAIVAVSSRTLKVRIAIPPQGFRARPERTST